MTQTARDTILAAVQRAPEWVRSDLASKDANARARAEDTLAAIIAKALVDTNTGT